MCIRDSTKGLSSSQISAARKAIDSGDKQAMTKVAGELSGTGPDASKVTKLADTLKELAKYSPAARWTNDAPPARGVLRFRGSLRPIRGSVTEAWHSWRAST